MGMSCITLAIMMGVWAWLTLCALLIANLTSRKGQ